MLAQLHYDPHGYCWVVMKCELRGKEGREKPVQWYPNQWNVQDALRKAGLLKTT
ncbi:hypothetical protein [Ktedonobacter racemifer]|uniref:Uncharacterized protein n=1 Tax=Ktedonobacter racemifer DSM 44963 TaxID=485913 RepID=D6TXM6_KTERA|nr:hypothetical protein [Ktedonobacter racemifer]EFH83073.1 hypothetical protein Krac_3988 [Ktedonobacter racemifer DSM 44963]